MELDLATSCITFNSQKVNFVLDEQQQPWWKGNEVAAALGYLVPTQAIYKNVKGKWKRARETLSNGETLSYNEKKETYINEHGLYSLIFK